MIHAHAVRVKNIKNATDHKDHILLLDSSSLKLRRTGSHGPSKLFERSRVGMTNMRQRVITSHAKHERSNPNFNKLILKKLP